MRVTVSNFRGLTDLRASVANILLISGPNGAGKTSACTAIAAAACGTVLPFDGITKKVAALLVRDGADLAAVELDSGIGVAGVTWPAAERTTTGIWKDISPVAAGLVDVSAVKPAERAALLIELIGAAPTEGDLRKALTAAEVPDAVIDEAVKAMPKGWDVAHAFFKDGGAKLKGKWEQVTAERYGKAKADGWRPKDWKHGMEALTAEECAEAIAQAEGALQATQQAQGATQALRDAWQVEADQLGKRAADLEAADNDLQMQIKRRNEVAQELKALGAKPEPGAEPLSCPCCKAAVRLKDGFLVSASTADFAELSEAAAEWERVFELTEKAQEAVELAQRYARSAAAKMAASKAAREHLAEGGEATDNSTEIEAAQAALAKAQATAEMRRKATEATGLAVRIENAAKVTELLDKTGLRQTKLVEALGEFNSYLVQASKSAGWSAVHVDADMAVTYGGRPLSLCSAGEQFRARVTIQLAVAAFGKAEFVVIDGADILDKAGRNGIFRVLNDLGFKAVIGMTLLKREEMPDLAKAGLGESVWIEGGVSSRAVKEAA